MSLYSQSRVVARATLLPGLIPRVREAVRAPFAVLAGFYADVLRMAGLLPATHPYLAPENAGRFGLLDVLRSAAVRLRFDLRHIDQVLVFFGLVATTVSFFVYLGVAIITFMMTPSFAGADVSVDVGRLMSSVYGFTQTPNPEKDVALMLLDRTLGIVGSTNNTSFFGSGVPTQCVSGEVGKPNCVVPPFPNSLQAATLSLLEFHSFVIFSFGVLFLLYLLSILVMDTAMKGKPIREKMDPFWTPLRLVLAIGLLVPIAPQGLNSAQYLVLYTAKYSSAFATNSWLYYHSWLSMGMGGASDMAGMPSYSFNNNKDPQIPISSPLAAKLSAPDVGNIVRFFHLVAACEYYYETLPPQPGGEKINVQGYFIMPGKAPRPAYREPDSKGWVPEYKPNDPSTYPFLEYKDALAHFNYGNIRIAFGVYDTKTSTFKPLCGELLIPVTSVKNPTTNIAKNPGAAIAHEYYYNYVMGLWDKTTYPRQLMDGFAAQMVENRRTKYKNSCVLDKGGDGAIDHPVTGVNLPELGACDMNPPGEYIQGQIERFQTIFQLLIQSANTELSDPKNFKIEQEVLDRGWAGAGVWFQHIASLNGAYVSAVQQMPYGTKYPEVLEDFRQKIMKIKPNLVDPDKFCGVPDSSGKTANEKDTAPATILCQINMYLKGDSANLRFHVNPNGPQGVSGLNGYIEEGQKKIDNILARIMNMVFGLDFIFKTCENRDTHPLVFLTTLGRTILETSARNLMTGSAIAAMGGMAQLGNEDAASSLKKIGNMFVTFASIMFSAGFMLYYVLPMLPFIYFFFAVLSWVKAVYEALLGAPMWALTYLDLQGDGIATKKSRGGVMLLLEILLRPIITVFSLIAAMAIFTALVMMINDMLPLALKVSEGSQMCAVQADQKAIASISLSGAVDSFFFVILYLLLMYMVAMNCFKIIDLIPNKFIRWIGSNAKSFAGDAYNRDTPSKGFTSNAYVAIANPMQGLIDKADEMTAEVAHAGAVITNGAESGGPLGKMVQDVFGKDRKTQANDAFTKAIEGMTTAHAKANKERTNTEKALAGGKYTTDKQIEDAQKNIEDKKRLEAINDPERILREIMNPGSSGIDRSKLNADEQRILDKNIEDLKKEIERTQPLVWEMLQSKTEAGGGVYATKDQTAKAVQSIITSAKKGILAKIKKEGI